MIIQKNAEKRETKKGKRMTKNKERKQAQPTYTNMYMHLMDEAQKIEDKITEKRKMEESTNKI